VVVHQASAEHMDFVSKNFQYVIKPFGEFMEAVDAGKRLYLRSLSAEKPSELPADLNRDFPTIANDFQLPPELKLVGENIHSSALRISGPVNMWLHYDVGNSMPCPNSLL
jgi:tRNA wybutosine-synthesizing protein 4